MRANGWHRAAWTLGARGVGDDLSDRLAPLEVDECSRLRAANRSPLPVGLTLVLGRTSLSAAGLAVSSVCDLVALNATSAIGSLCAGVRPTEDDGSSVGNALRMQYPQTEGVL